MTQKGLRLECAAGGSAREVPASGCAQVAPRGLN